MREQLPLIVEQIRLGQEQTPTAMQKATNRPEVPIHNGAGEVHGERHGQHQDIADARAYGKEGRIIERPKIDGSVNRVRRVVELRSDRETDLGLAVDIVMAAPYQAVTGAAA